MAHLISQKQWISFSSPTLFSSLCCPCFTRHAHLSVEIAITRTGLGSVATRKTIRISFGMCKSVHTCVPLKQHMCRLPASSEDPLWSQGHPPSPRLLHTNIPPVTIPLFLFMHILSVLSIHPPPAPPVILTSPTLPTQTFWELSGGSSPLLWEIEKHSWGVVIEAY